MTFLELCASFTTRSGIIGTAPAAVTGQTGRQAKCVDWVAEAWRLIQMSSPYFTFLNGEWSGALVINQTAYTSTQLSIASRFGRWKGDRPGYRPVTLYDPAIGVSDEAAIPQWDYERWRTSFGRGAQTAMRPICYAIAPDGTLRFGPKPDKAYVAKGDYRKSAQILAANGDIPEVSEEHHSIIVYRGIMLAAEHDESPNGLAGAITKHAEGMGAFNRDYLPPFEAFSGSPIA